MFTWKTICLSYSKYKIVWCYGVNIERRVRFCMKSLWSAILFFQYSHHKLVQRIFFVCRHRLIKASSLSLTEIIFSVRCVKSDKISKLRPLHPHIQTKAFVMVVKVEWSEYLPVKIEQDTLAWKTANFFPE